ncbi:uncharacterized protein LOC107030064 [Solanum pennellii]|uniref:Uncharacterized protein LOC107030064 n=1 Tax=Solanum pennellii TaxID=28526 RepID=A0ABM1HKW3_SOLPN|nr:uncharacterized protein LOC107030064 [Solanum pennellii]
MYVVDVENVELSKYQLKGVARTWFDQWKDGRVEDAPRPSCACFKEAFLGRFFPCELKEAKIGMKFNQLSHYALEIVNDMRSIMSRFVAGLGRASSKEGRASIMVGDMDIYKLMVYVQQVEEEKSHAPSSTSAPAPRNRSEYSGQNSQHFKARPALSQGCVVQGGSFHERVPKEKQGGGKPGNRAQSSAVALPNRDAPRGVASGIGEGTNRLYAFNNHHEQENLSNVITGMIRSFDFTAYALLDPRASLSFVTLYVAMNFEISPE